MVEWYIKMHHPAPGIVLNAEAAGVSPALRRYWSIIHVMEEKRIPGVRNYRSVEEAWQAHKEWVRSPPARPVVSPEVLVIPDRGELARRLLGTGRQLSPDHDAISELVAERADEDEL
jgi:hypothetical protein